VSLEVEVPIDWEVASCCSVGKVGSPSGFETGDWESKQMMFVDSMKANLLLAEGLRICHA